MDRSWNAPTVRMDDLTDPCQQLVSLMRRVGFGRIEDLRVVSGEPTFDPPPRVIREVKLDSRPGNALDSKDFALKSEIRALFEELRVIGDGTVSAVEIRHGLPTRLIQVLGGAE